MKKKGSGKRAILYNRKRIETEAYFKRLFIIVNYFKNIDFVNEITIFVS